MLEIGTIIKANDFILRVNGFGGTWIRFEYWDKVRKEWRMRGATEKKAKVESHISSGEWVILNESELDDEMRGDLLER